MRLTLPLLLVALLVACGQAGPLVRPADIPSKPVLVPVAPVPAAQTPVAETPAIPAEPQTEKTPEAAAPAN